MDFVILKVSAPGWSMQLLVRNIEMLPVDGEMRSLPEK